MARKIVPYECFVTVTLKPREMWLIRNALNKERLRIAREAGYTGSYLGPPPPEELKELAALMQKLADGDPPENRK